MTAVGCPFVSGDEVHCSCFGPSLRLRLVEKEGLRVWRYGRQKAPIGRPANVFFVLGIANSGDFVGSHIHIDYAFGNCRILGIAQDNRFSIRRPIRKIAIARIVFQHGERLSSPSRDDVGGEGLVGKLPYEKNMTPVMRPAWV